MLNKHITFNKTKRNQKWKIPHTDLEGRTLRFSSYKIRKLKVTLWWAGARERKKRPFFLPFTLSEGNFLNICVLPPCIVFWIHFQNIHPFTWQKILLHTLLLLVFKIKTLQCIVSTLATNWIWRLQFYYISRQQLHWKRNSNLWKCFFKNLFPGELLAIVYVIPKQGVWSVAKTLLGHDPQNAKPQ